MPKRGIRSVDRRAGIFTPKRCAAVKGQLTIVAASITAVVFLILAMVAQNITTAAQQAGRTINSATAGDVAKSAASWLTNTLNTQPDYISEGLGPFAIDGAYTPPNGQPSASQAFVSSWFQLEHGHWQACPNSLLQPCVRLDPATLYFSAAYNPASANMTTPLKEENVVATFEVEQNCQGSAASCQDSFYSTTIARRGYYNYLAFTNYATLDPAQYSPLGLVNPGSICQTNNTASGCVPVSYQSNGTPSTNGIFGGSSQTAPVFNGSVQSGTTYQASIDSNKNLVPDSNLAFATSPIDPTWSPNGPGFGSSANEWSVRNAGTDNAELLYAGNGQSSGYNSVFTPSVTLTAGDAYTISADINASAVVSGDNCAFQLIQEGGPLEAQAMAPTSGNGVFSATYIPPTTAAYYFNAICYNVVVPTGSYVYFSQLEVTQSSSVEPYAPGPLYTSSSNVTLEGWADVPSTGDQGMVAFSGNTTSGFGIGIGTGMQTGGAPDMQVMVLYQYARWIPTGFDVTAGWHQFVLALNASGQPSVYVDGTLVYSDTGSPPATPTGPVLIGTDGNTGRYYSGAIADVSVYNTDLSQSQIQDQYTAGSAGSYDAVVALDQPVGFWELSDGVGASTAADASGNGNVGQYQGSVAQVQPGPFSGSGSQAVTGASTVNNGDSIYGALRTNSPTIYVCDGNPSAFDVPLMQATSANVATATQPGCGLPSSSTLTQQVSPMAMPTDVGSLNQAAFPYIFPDGTSFDFTPSGVNIAFTGSASYMTNNWPALYATLMADATVVLVNGSSVSIQNMAIPGNGVLYVNGSVSNVVGVVKGQVTIAAEGNIDVNAQPDPTVGENLYYYCNGQGAINPEVIASGCSDLLGLDAQGSVAIGPQSYQQTGWAYYGTGSAAGWYSVLSPSISVTAGTTYNLTGTLDSTAVSITNAAPYNGEQMIQVVTNTGSYYMQTFQTPGTNGVVTSSWTVPSGVSSVQILLDTDNITVPAGEAVTWSNVTFTQSGSTTNLAAPMANWPANGNPIGNGNGDWNLVPSELAPMVVDAAMTALGNSPGVADSNGSIYGAQWQTPNPNAQNPACLVDAPTLTINGAIISEYQGTFGQYLGLYPATNPCLLSGYHKHFFWDSRLAYEQPPFALSSGSGNFVEMGLTEVSRP